MYFFHQTFKLYYFWPQAHDNAKILKVKVTSARVSPFSVYFLAHLSTKCSWCFSCSGELLWSVVVRRPSKFDVYTLETTFVIRFLWNLVNMFVLMKLCQNACFEYGSKTRSQGKILGNTCLHSRGHISDPILMKLGQNVCFYNIKAKIEYGSCRVKN